MAERKSKATPKAAEKGDAESTAEEPAQAESAAEEAATSESTGKKGMEEKLDEFADRFSKAVTDGVKRMEGAFEKGVHDIRDNPSFSKSRVRGFFTSSTGGSVLVVIGFVWLFYAIGLLDKPVFPALLIILGFYIMHRYKSED